MNFFTLLSAISLTSCFWLFQDNIQAQGQQNGRMQQGQSMLQLNPNVQANPSNQNSNLSGGNRHGQGYSQGQGHGHGHGNGHGQGAWNNSCQGGQIVVHHGQHNYGHYTCHNYGWRPVCTANFNSGCHSIRNYTFDNERLRAAKRFAQYNYLTVQQICQIMHLFTFESTKLKFAKFAFGRTCDIQNYYQVYDRLTFGSSRRALNSYIQQYYY